MGSSEGGEESQDDECNMLKRYLQLINLLQETIPHVALNFIPPDLQNPERFYQHVADYFKKLNPNDGRNLKKLKRKIKRSGGNEEQLFSKIGVPTMHKILTKIKIFKDNLPKNAIKKLYMWKLLENEVVRDGWDIAESPEDFNEWLVRIKDVLVELGVSEEVIENKLNIIVINKDEHESLQEQVKTLQDLNKQMKENERKICASAARLLECKNQIHIEEFVGKNKGHKSMAELLEPVVREEKDHDSYGEHFSKIDDAYYIVQQPEFSLGGEKSNVFLGYFRQLNAHPWVAIKTSTLLDKQNEFDNLKENLGQNSSEPHKNVISFYAHATFGSQFFLIMPLCDHTLDEYLKTNVSYVERCNLAKQFLKGMSFLHDKNIIHHDLKPNNVLIKFDVKMKAVLKISDFNVSCRVSTEESDNEEIENAGHWMWDAPEKEDFKEDDVFTSCLLLCYIFFGKHPFTHSTRRDLERVYNEMKSDVKKKSHEGMMAIESRPLSKWYNRKDCHDDVLKYIDKILVHFFEHKLQRDIERNQEMSSENQSVVTEAVTNKKEQLKNELKMSKICNDFKYQVYSIKHPKRTNGKRYAVFASYSYQKIFSDAVEDLLEDQDKDEVDGPLKNILKKVKKVKKMDKDAVTKTQVKTEKDSEDSSGKRKDDMKSAEKGNLLDDMKNFKKEEFAGIEDVAVLRKVFKNCQFSIIPEWSESGPKVSDVVDITNKKFMDNIRAVYKEVGSEYEGDVYLFIWISAHGYHDTSKGDTRIKCGYEEDGESFYINNRIEAINKIFDENPKVHLKILMAVSCCRAVVHQNGSQTDNTTPGAQYSTDTGATPGFIPADELPNTNFTPTSTTISSKNVYGIYSTSLGHITPSNKPNSTYPSIFGDALANEIMPNRSIKETFERVIDRKPTYYMRGCTNKQLQKHTLQPELFPHIDEEIGKFVF